MKTIRNLLNNKKGLTLIELVISLALLGMTSIILVSMFGTGIAVLNHADQLTKDSMNTAGELETSVSAGGEVGTKVDLEFFGPGNPVLKGSQATKIGEDGVTYHIFIPEK